MSCSINENLPLDRPVELTDDSDSDRRLGDEAEWRAHRNWASALPLPQRLCHLRRWQIHIVDVDDRDVRLHVDASDLRARGSPILQRHLYFLGAEGHVCVYHNITVVTDDNT